MSYSIRNEIFHTFTKEIYLMKRKTEEIVTLTNFFSDYPSNSCLKLPQKALVRGKEIAFTSAASFCVMSGK